MTSFRFKIHILNRLGFGPSFTSINEYLTLTERQLIQRLIQESKSYTPIRSFDPTKISYDDLDGLRGFKSKIKRKNQFKRLKQRINKMWIDQMIGSKAQLREKMALFWHDHFSTDVNNPRKTMEQLNCIRKHALGNFKTLLTEISKGPAMIDYLNNKENVKQHANENFAREILELFTLGVGNYTEKDIQEAARAFTGWRYNEKGKQFTDLTNHDDGIKTFMGHKGAWKGEDIIRIILENPQTARYITSKVYYFLTGVSIDKQKESILATDFLSHYNITRLIKKIVLDPSFFTTDIMGTRVKSPVELMVSSSRMLGVQFQGAALAKKIQIRLDQNLLNPPNVAGWNHGSSWINTGTLPDRMLLAYNLYTGKANHLLKTTEQTTEGDALIISENKEGIKRINKAGLEKWVKQSCGHNLELVSQVLFSCDTHHLGPKLNSLQQALLEEQVSGSEAVVILMSMPEYQMN